ncbi:hypothetical protein A5873_001007, partial [Enterococcus faecium]
MLKYGKQVLFLYDLNLRIIRPSKKYRHKN